MGSGFCWALTHTGMEAAELLLDVILQRSDLKVLEAVAQREYKNPMSGGRSITIDIYAVDGDRRNSERKCGDHHGG